MKKALALFTVTLALGMTAAMDAQAKRIGGARSGGMQRQNVTAPANPPAAPGVTQGATRAAPAAAPAASAGAAAAAAPKRSWMGPIAGLAAGLGIAALASHFGFGEALANMLMMGLIAMAVLLLVGFILRKRAAGRGPALAGAGGTGQLQQRESAQQQPAPFLRSTETPAAQGGSMIGSRVGAGIGSGLAPAATQAGNIPADFDVAAFVRNAKAHFVGLQAANDARDLDRLRDFLTPQMFELVRAEIAERGTAAQETQVFGLEAQVLDVAEEDGVYVVSVLFTGSVREQPGVAPDDLNEIWHLTKPRTGMGGWVVAGIQQA